MVSQSCPHVLHRICDPTQTRSTYARRIKSLRAPLMETCAESSNVTFRDIYDKQLRCIGLMYLAFQRLSPILSLCIALDIHSTNLPVLAKALVDPIARRLHCMSAGDPSIVSAGLAPPFTLFRTRHSLHHFALYQISQTCWIEGRVTCTSAGDPSIVSAGTTPPAYFVSHKTLSPPL